tara:strand:- start:653 stop:814 length:162 start_codon:yes stop_codon:yes gene_type:complete
VEVALSDASGSFSIEWFDPTQGSIVEKSIVEAGEIRMTAPFEGDAVLFLERTW